MPHSKFLLSKVFLIANKYQQRNKKIACVMNLEDHLYREGKEVDQLNDARE